MIPVTTDPIFVAGGSGMVGGALVRKLREQGFSNVFAPSSRDLNLTIQAEVMRFFEETRPSLVIMAAAKVGGIVANSTYPYEFIAQNLQIQSNVFEASLAFDVPRLLFLGSSCIYPREAQQPIVEEALLGGPLEPTNKPYAIAKIAGIVQVQSARAQFSRDWISAQPTNLFGIGDNYHPENSHVIPGLIRRYHHAKVSGSSRVVNWGSGTPTRDFLFSEDAASALLFLLRNFSGSEAINIGSGQEVSIKEVAALIAREVGFKGITEWDSTRPDGTPRKVLDSSKLSRLGWAPSVSIEEGIGLAVNDYVSNLRNGSVHS